jgi:hypothetical protein
MYFFRLPFYTCIAVCRIGLTGLLFICLGSGCTPGHKEQPTDACASLAATQPQFAGRGALLGTRFQSLEALKQVVQIEYVTCTKASADSTGYCAVYVRHCSNGIGITGVLEQGTTQGDILKARHGSLWDRLLIVLNCPYAVMHRNDLGRANAISRWRPQWFGEGDRAFYDIAKRMVAHINTPELAFLYPRDSTEKGYLNTFNHVTSQALITSCFSEELADFIGDAHERDLHPELITGIFTEKQLNDLEDGPVDNYVDIVNNEWGKALGNQLARQFGVHRDTKWTPALAADYLNALQGYFGWAFQIGFQPFRPEEEAVQRFSEKMDAILRIRAQFYD